MKRWYKLAALVAGVATLAGVGATARVADAAPSATAPVQVGIVYSRTGRWPRTASSTSRASGRARLRDQGHEQAVGDRKIELTEVDDAGDPAKAVSAAKDLIGKGVQDHRRLHRLRGGAAGRAARRAEQGAVHLRPGRDRRGDRGRTSTRSAPAGSRTRTCSPPSRSSATSPARRSSSSPRTGAFGHGNEAAVKKVMRSSAARGDRRRSWCRPAPPSSPRSPAGQEPAHRTCCSSPGPAPTAPAMWRALDQQGVFSSVHKVVTGLDQRASCPTFGAAGDKISFLSHYFDGAANNRGHDWLVAADAEARPGARPVPPGRLRRRPDDRAGADARAATTWRR